MTAVEAAGLVKSFGATRAVDGVDLSIPAGGVHAVLGPNGAGKTTTIRMLATLLRPDAGTARVFGHDVVRDPAAVRARISLTGQYASVDEGLTARENLVLLGRLHGLSRRRAAGRAAELLEAFGLAAADRLVKTYSGGMRRRLDVAAGLIVPPDLLFLDEPTTGLDPRSRNDVWTMIRTLVAERGTTVLLTTQYLDEADRLADRIAVIDHGRLIAEGTSAALKASVGGGTLRVRLAEAAERPAAEKVLTRAFGEVALDADPVALTARVPGAGAAARALAELPRVTEFSLGQPTLDEVFLALTGDAR